MKKLAILLSFLILSGCTQESVIKSTALRSVIEQYDAQQAPDKSVEERKKTHINVEKVEMVSDTEAKVEVSIKSPNENKLVPVHLVKKEGWSVVQ